MSQASHTWIFGRHAVIAALENPNRIHKKLYLSKRLHDQLSNQTYNKNIPIEIVQPEVLDKKFGHDAVHQGIALQTSPLPLVQLDDILNQCEQKSSSLIVVLDQITDPHNVGAITRSAAAFHVDALLLPSFNSADHTSPILAKTACGGIEHVPLITVNNVSRSLHTLQNAGYWCIGLDEKGESALDKIDLQGKICIILGAEGSGLRRLTRQSCDLLCHLPTTPSFPTLNVSNAAAISFYEYGRQNSSG